MNLRSKMLALAVSAAALPAGLLLATLTRSVAESDDAISAAVGEQVRSDMALVQASVRGLVEVGDDALQRKVGNDLVVARDVMHDLGVVREHPGERVTWDAINQFTKASAPVELPKMMAGAHWLGQISSFDAEAPVVDHVQQLVGGTATIFQRMNEAGDMLRVATNVRKLDGKRAIGTYIPAKNPDGTANAVVSTVLGKKTFRGRAFVVNAWYITAYEPILDPDGRVIGVLYVGVKQNEVQTVGRALTRARIGASGRVSALSVGGKDAGDVVMSGHAERVGKNAKQLLDADGAPYLEALVARAEKLEAGEVGQSTVWLKGADGERREVLLSYTYFAPWKWLLVGEAWLDEHDAAVAASQDILRSLEATAAGLAVMCLLLTLVVAVLVVRSISRPLGFAVEALEDVADGDADLTAQLAADSDDEVGRLGRAFNGFVGKLSCTVRQVADGARGIGASVEDLLGASTSLSQQATQVRDHTAAVSGSVSGVAGTVSRSAAASTQASSSMAAVASTTRAVEGDVRGILEQSEQTSESMVAVAAALEQMNASLDEVARGAAGTAAAGEEAEQQARDAHERMQALSGATSKITRVVELIQDIADQTNLLALNATIEAAGAGEAGRGFAVVAAEVKTLAAQTAKATEEIAAEIVSIQGEAVRTAESIEQVSDRVRKAAALAQSIAAATEQQSSTNAEIAHNVSRASDAALSIKDAVQSITERIQGVARQSDEVSSGVQQIASFNESIDDAVQEVVARLRALDAIAVDAAGAADVVKDRAGGIRVQAAALSDEVGRFRTTVN